MREVPRHKLVATSLCAGPRRIAWASAPFPLPSKPKSSCLCGSAARHCVEFARHGDELRVHDA